MKILLVSFILVWCGAIGFAQETPVIGTIVPDQHEIGAPFNTSISVTFSTTMDPSTINSSSFVVNASSSSLHSGLIAYNEDTFTAVMVPDNWFRGGEVVSVALTTDIQSSDNIPLESNYLWSFTIAVPEEVEVIAPLHNYATNLTPLSVYVADFDNDLNLDVATANQNTADISILFNAGEGVFAPPVNYQVGENPGDFCASDFNGDGFVDLACTSRRFDNIAILLNSGDGTFGELQGYPTGDTPVSATAGDFDADGDIDLATANMWSNDVSILLNNGDGTFESRLDFDIEGNPNAVSGVEGWLEIIAQYKSRNMELYQMLLEYPVGDGPYSIAAGDIDRDGDLDLATANLTQGTISVLSNDGNAVFSTHATLDAGEFPSSICFVDLNADRSLDLVCADLGLNTVYAYLNFSDGDFVFQGQSAVGDYPNSLFCGDLDGDNDMDMFTANTWSNDITVLYNDGDGVFSSIWQYPVGSSPLAVFGADVSGNGAIDLVAANSGADNVSVYLIVRGCDYYVPGDYNHNGSFNVSDIISMHSRLATGSPEPGFTCDCAGRVWGVVADVNNSCSFNINDVIHALSFITTGGPPIEPCELCLPSHP